MPGGHDYPGPAEALEQYGAVVEAAAADTEIKGAKNPYTSRNGHMFSFLTPDGTLAIHLSDEDGGEFQSQYDSGPVLPYGSAMRVYVSVPDDLLADPEAAAPWFDTSWGWIGSLPPKPTRKSGSRAAGRSDRPHHSLPACSWTGSGQETALSPLCAHRRGRVAS